MLCYAVGYGLMIFSGSLEGYASVGIPSLLVGVCLVGLVVALWSSQQFCIARPDSNTAAILAVSLAGTDPTFRELFGDEALDESQNIGIKNITFLVSDLKGSTALYDAVGDVQGYHLVRRHFAALTGAVAGHSGAIVKTIGDDVMATFADPVDAVSSAIDIVREVEEMNRTLSERLCLKMGIHGGHCLLVTLNNRRDYFGQTVNIVYRLLRLARGGELCLSTRMESWRPKERLTSLSCRRVGESVLPIFLWAVRLDA